MKPSLHRTAAPPSSRTLDGLSGFLRWCGHVGFLILSGWLACFIAVSPGSVLASTPSPASAQTAREAILLLKSECWGCHNAEKKKGGLNLTSPEGLLRGAGSESGSVVTSGHPEESRLIQVLAVEADPHMPPKRQLSSSEIGLLGRWVRDGAVWDATTTLDPVEGTPVPLGNLPAGYHPTMAMAISPEGRQLAVGRGGVLLVYDVLTTNLSLRASIQAHPDVIQSIAWMADSKGLASAGMQRVVVFRLTSGGLQLMREWTRGIVGQVTAMQFSPGDQSLLIAQGGSGQPGWLRLLSMNDPVGHAAKSWMAHRDTIFDLQISATTRSNRAG